MNDRLKIGGTFILLFILGTLLVGSFFGQSKKDLIGLAETEVKPKKCQGELSKESLALLDQLSAVSWGVYCFSDESLLVLMKGKNLYTKQGIASITKIITAYLAEQTWNDEDEFQIPVAAIGYGTSGRYSPGQKFKTGELIASLIIESDNDVARTIALRYGTETFLKRMNLFAKNLGLSDTSFRDPAGLDIGGEPSNLSTVADVAKMAKFVFTQSRHFKYDAHEPTRLTYSTDGVHHTAIATNKLLSTPLQKYIVAWKTGETAAAKKNLVVMFEDGQGDTYLSVVLNSDDHIGDTRKIMEEVVK